MCNMIIEREGTVAWDNKKKEKEKKERLEKVDIELFPTNNQGFGKSGSG